MEREGRQSRFRFRFTTTEAGTEWDNEVWQETMANRCDPLPLTLYVLFPTSDCSFTHSLYTYNSLFSLLIVLFSASQFPTIPLVCLHVDRRCFCFSPLFLLLVPRSHLHCHLSGSCCRCFVLFRLVLVLILSELLLLNWNIYRYIYMLFWLYLGWLTLMQQFVL
mgnify:CR=1 FL=1